MNISSEKRKFCSGGAAWDSWILFCWGEGPLTNKIQPILAWHILAQTPPGPQKLGFWYYFLPICMCVCVYVVASVAQRKWTRPKTMRPRVRIPVKNFELWKCHPLIRYMWEAYACNIISKWVEVGPQRRTADVVGSWCRWRNISS